VSEIVVAFGLCFSGTRKLAMWSTVGIHLLLLGILGPWGLGHQPGVLIWNVFFIAQNLILFQPIASATRTDSDNKRPLDFLGYFFTGAVVLLPFLEPIGFYDHWPAWAVYASRPERTRGYISENRLPELPVELKLYLTENEKSPDEAERFLAGKAPWRRLRIDRWSLETLRVPLYPQDRFQLGVALSLAETYHLEDGVRVEIDSPADRFSGERTTRVLEGTDALKVSAREYRMNSLAR
jgi:hypothetical protein